MEKIVRLSIVILVVLLVSFTTILNQACSQNKDEELWSTKIADTFLSRHPDATTYDSASPNERWNYEQGLMLIALYQKWIVSGNSKYLDFVKRNLDKYVSDDGVIRTYKIEDYNLDNLAGGRVLLNLYESTKENKYKQASDLLMKQLKDQPRTKEGGFWHKKIYPYQMWLDGLYMAEPFYAKYSLMINDSNSFDDIANQFIYMFKHSVDFKTRLLYHGWDESKKQKWSDSTTGCSPSFWSRSMGWYLMALIDVLDYYPAIHPKRQELIKIFQNLSDTILKYRDPQRHLWYQVIDQPGREGNYLEASASCMFVYAFLKGSSKGYLEELFYKESIKSFDGITNYFISMGKDGLPDLTNTCRSAGLGGDPYRDGSYEYYISEPKRTNDMKGVGAFLLAALEMEKINKNKLNR
ncbi:MAG: glycoside hydrolase family 88 protein [Ignavibacteriales bacterium]|nr:glycoside hydrolase family 88 protein [Ignavibacteriales bacterium]